MRKSLRYYTHVEESLESYGANSAYYNGHSLAHLAIHNSLNRNAGDTLLPRSVRQAFDVISGDFNWQKHQVWEEFSSSRVKKLNNEVDALIVGGGGFLIRDQQGGNTAKSGWLWNISTDTLAELRSKIVLFAIGYNRFRGQADFDPSFKKHISKTVEKSVFVGLRNTGSIEQLSNYLDSDELVAKLKLQYCPTTACWQLYEDMAKLASDFDSKQDRPRVLAFNFAYDRPSMRFGDNEDRILKSLATAIKKIENAGWEIVLTAHKVIDRAIETYLDGAKVNYQTHDLTEATHTQIMQHYAQCDLAIGMRGHGQMIPFGLRRPIISLISHNKMSYFLDDIGHPEWGLELGAEDFEEQLWALFSDIAENNLPQTKAAIDSAQEKAWQLTNKNVGWICQQLGVGLKQTAE